MATSGKSKVHDCYELNTQEQLGWKSSHLISSVQHKKKIHRAGTQTKKTLQKAKSTQGFIFFNTENKNYIYVALDEQQIITVQHSEHIFRSVCMRISQFSVDKGKLYFLPLDEQIITAGWTYT